MEEVDFPKLKACNALCKKWAEYFKISKRDYIRFIIEIYKNPAKFLAMLPSKKRPQLSKDLKNMFYGFEVENQLIEKHLGCILHICKKFRVKNPNTLQELKEIGMLSIRSSVWHYLDRNTSFLTFVYNGLVCSIRGHLSHLKNLRNGPRYKFSKTLLSLSNLTKEMADDEFDFMADKSKQSPADNFIQKHESIDLEDLCNRANLDENERKLVSLYVEKKISCSRKNWLKDLLLVWESHHDGKKINKYQIRSKIKKIKHKMYDAAVRIRGIKEVGEYINPFKIYI